MDPLLIDVPERLETDRLIVRCPQPGDGPAVNEAVRESLAELGPFMPWAQTAPSLDESEALCRRNRARFCLREDLPYWIFERDAAGCEGRYIGGTGLHRISWEVRRFEIGYWCRTSCQRQGYVTEAARALMRAAFDRLGARRVEVRMEDGNAASQRVAERLGFTLEGILRQDSLTPRGEPRDTRVYARVRGIEEPMAG
ncbi:MAG TPA: GNAT family N-acetyltransferase [Burkholderiaceae bacterium]|nr:GNAT family N-acetyltransferase [Burkholderiaceae bacterium]